MKNFSRIYRNIKVSDRQDLKHRKEMLKEIKLLNWQVRSVKGDIMRLVEDREAVLEMIWKLTKLTRKESGPERVFMVRASLNHTNLAFELVPKQLFKKTNLN